MYVTATLLDAAGTLAQHLRPNVTVAVDGPGKLLSVATGDPMDPGSLQSPSRRFWHGRVVAIVQPAGPRPGTIHVSATVPGLPPASVAVQSVL